ncbi:MAG: hypothetical protein AAFY88_24955, partial [Acidobacteriota bacterium]
VTLRSEAESLRLHSEVDALLRAADAGGVSFYALAPQVRSASGVAERGRLSLQRPGAAGRLPSAQVENIRSALCWLSTESGGRCQVGGAEPRQLVDRTVGDLSAVYRLAVTPPAPSSADDDFRELEVEVSRPDLQVRHRRGYRERSADDRAAARLAAALYFGAEDDELGMTVELGEVVAEETGGLSRIPFDVRVPVERLDVQAEGDGFRARARLLVSYRAGAPGAGDAALGDSIVQEVAVDFGVRAEQLAAQPPIVYSHEVILRLAPGSYTVALGLVNGASGLSSVRRLEVVVP